MSDSHGDCEIVEEIKQKYLGKVDAIYHNGDSELASDDPIWEGIHVVSGNCDFDNGYPNDLITHWHDLTIAQTHGHLYNINFTWDKLDWFAQEHEADICLYGHLHRPAVWQMGNTIFLNPGSVSQPRGDINEKLYAKVELDNSTIKVTFLNRQHQEYSGLTKVISR